MTANEKRIRVFEIIAGILLILLALNMYYTFLHALLQNISYTTSGYLVSNIPAFLAGAFMILHGIMMICRKYDKLWMKIVYGITGAGAVMSTNGGYVIRGYFNTMYLAPQLTIFYIASAVIMAAAIVVALLSMCKVIKWRSRSKLLIYTYIMTGLEIIIYLGANDYNYTTAAALMLPCLMQEAQQNTKKISIAGEVSFWLLPVLRRVLTSLDGVLGKFFGFIKHQATGKNPPEYGDGNTVSSDMIILISIILLALIPLMAFGRKFISEKEASPARSVPKDSGEADDK